MLWLSLRQLAARRTSSGLAALGLLVAALGFLTLTSASETTETVLRGDIGRAWHTPYDLLIRPAGSVSTLEAAQGLVRPNYISGLADGGITLAQLDAIRRIPGVEVAAPVAVVGVVNWQVQGFGVQLAERQARTPLAVYRLTITSSTDAGMSSAQVERHYVVVATQGVLRVDPRTLRGELRVGGHVIDCTYPVSCHAPQECFGDDACQAPETPLSYGIEMLQPMLIAGIDPAAEARLAGLDRCVVEGRYLQPDDRLAPPAADRDPPGVQIPVLVSTRSFVDETLSGRLVEAINPAPVARGASPRTLTAWRPVSQTSATADQLYRRYLPRVGQEVDEWPVWSVGDVTYRERAGAGLVAVTRAPDLPVYERTNTSIAGFPPGLLIPPAARDRWFRPVTEHGYRRLEGNRYWDPVGTYDPACLPGFDPLAGGGLETYAVPSVRLADGRELRPTRSMGGYVNIPPLILTTLEGASWFADPRRFEGRPGRAFIGVIRVRVAGAGQPGPIAEARLGRVAADVHEATGLQVDVVKGASPRPVQVGLPAGLFGRPALTVTEPWSVKGVALRFVRAVSAQNVALFGLALVGATVLIGETAFISVRRRRSQFGVLRALGWPTRRIAVLVELEMLWLGLAVGLVALAASVPLELALRTRVLGWAAAATVPLTLAVAGLAALLPAMAAARGTTVRVISARGRIRRSRSPRSAITLGLRELAGPWRAEALLGITAIALGAAMLGGVVLISIAFKGQLDTTVLGTYLAGRVRPFHLIVAVLTLAIGALAAGQIVTLGYLERQVHLAALRALGWPRSHVLRLLTAQGLALGLLGGLTGALAVGVAAALMHARPAATALATATSLVVALAATALAVAGPLLHAYHAPLADVLRGE